MDSDMHGAVVGIHAGVLGLDMASVVHFPLEGAPADGTSKWFDASVLAAMSDQVR